MTAAHRIVIWVFAVRHNSIKRNLSSSEQRTGPTRYLQKRFDYWSGRLETVHEILTIWICFPCDLSEASDAYSGTI